MEALNASSSSLILQSSMSCSSSNSNQRRIGFTTKAKATLNIPKSVLTTKINLPAVVGSRSKTTFEEIEKQLSPNVEAFITKIKRDNDEEDDDGSSLVVAKLYALSEAVADRVEMHKNIGDQRNNWNSLLLSSINALTLSAATMAGIASLNTNGGAAAMAFSASAMYAAATGMLSIMSKIQPSQLAEEQRNATRLFKELHHHIQTLLSINGNPTASHVKEIMAQVLALDRAFPLPLLGGAMLDKFPAAVEPAVWWPENRRRQQQQPAAKSNGNGWNRKLEEEMKGIAKVIRGNDEEEYLRLGGKALKLNKFLAIAAPVLTATAAVSSAALVADGGCGWAAALAVGGGALATVVNSLEHGGQVGMVFEMYRSNAGFFKLMEESIEGNLKEEDFQRRENGEIVELKVALKLGRSLSELRNLAENSSSAAIDDEEFASKLF